MSYDVNIVADDFLVRSKLRGRAVSNLMLQKLLYYAQAWFLVLADAPLFDAKIEAWVHGPVVPSVFRRFKHFRWDPITVPETVAMNAELSHHIDAVLDAYGHLSGRQLELLTHSEDPWRNARRGIAPDEPSNATISHEAMKRYYKQRLEPSR